MISDRDLKQRQLAADHMMGRGAKLNPPAGKLIRRGEPGFDRALEWIEDSYVDTDCPGLKGYTYKADLVSIYEGKEIMDEILDNVVEVRDGDRHPMFRLKGESEWKSVVNSDDFPQPSTEGPGSSGGTQENGPGDEGDLCYEDCACPTPCDCVGCDCGDGKECCCGCVEDDEPADEDEEP